MVWRSEGVRVWTWDKEEVWRREVVRGKTGEGEELTGLMSATELVAGSDLVRGRRLGEMVRV